VLLINCQFRFKITSELQFIFTLLLSLRKKGFARHWPQSLHRFYFLHFIHQSTTNQASHQRNLSLMTTVRGMAQEIITRSRSNSATPVAAISTHHFSNFTSDASDLHWMAEATAWTETLAQCAESPPLDPTFAS
jgi:hypothetical protein